MRVIVVAGPCIHFIDLYNYSYILCMCVVYLTWTVDVDIRRGVRIKMLTFTTSMKWIMGMATVDSHSVNIGYE